MKLGGRRRVALAGVVTLMILGGWIGTSAVAGAGTVAGGTVVGGVPVEGLEAAQLMERLAPAARALDRRPITLVVGERTWVRSPEGMGIVVDLRASAESALMAGRNGSLSWMMRALGAGSENLEWIPRIDEARFQRAVEDLAALVRVEASNGEISVSDSTVNVKPPSDGYELLVDPARRALVRAAVRPTTEDQLELPVEVTSPQITVAHQDRIKKKAETILSAPIAFIHEGSPFQVAASQVAGTLSVKVVGSDLLLEADPALLKERIIAAAPRVNRVPKDAVFSVSGDRVTLQASQDGSTIDAQAAAAAVVGLAEGERKPIVLASVVESPALTTEAASKLGIKQRISHFTTPFDARNAPRVGNIDRMAAAIDGKLLRPGETFSLNQTTGNRTVANGYQEAGILVDGELVPGIGGGVCQVATTLFNAVFTAGLDVVERSNHSLFVSSYPTGKDAMVNYGVQDLRFRNDTEFGMLLKARVSPRELTVSIYSSPLGRTVTESTSPQTNPKPPELRYLDDPTLPAGTEVVTAEGKPGFDVTVTRRVVSGGKVLHSDNFVSKYRPWKRVIKKGTGPPAPVAPAPEPGPEEQEPPETEPTPSPSPSASPSDSGA